MKRKVTQSSQKASFILIQKADEQKTKTKQNKKQTKNKNKKITDQL